MKAWEGRSGNNAFIKRSLFAPEFLKVLAKEARCSGKAIEVMDRFNLARELPSLLSEADASCLFTKLLSQCHKHCAEIFPNTLDVVLLADDGKILSRTGS